MHATGVTARELEAAGSDLARRRKRVRDAAYLAASCAFVALLTLPWSTAAAIALAGGAVVGGLMAVCGELARQGPAEPPGGHDTTPGSNATIRRSSTWSLV